MNFNIPKLRLKSFPVLDADMYTKVTKDGNTVYCLSFKCGDASIATIDVTEEYFEQLYNTDDEKLKLTLFQMINTPIVHHTLLSSISKFIFDVKDGFDADVKESLESWLQQTEQLLHPPVN